VSSIPGFLMTVTVIVIIGAFAERKAENLLLRQNPVITPTYLIDVFDDSYVVNFN
jgi:uncharacterized protein YneF (UPF0154 family)